MAGGKNVVDFSAVRALVADAEEIPSADALGRDPLPGQNNSGGVACGKWEPNALGLPEDCPVHPLGVLGENTLVFLDVIGQLHTLPAPYGKGAVMALFGGRLNYLCWAWPRYNKDGAVTGFHNDEAVAALQKACYSRGPWEGVDILRGRGAWQLEDGNLVLHTGRHLLVRGRVEQPGELDGHVYPRRPPVQKPWPEPVDVQSSPVRLLKTLFRSWTWKRPDVDPVLLMGWVSGALIGGALPWRPIAYLTGDKGTGKSTLQDVIKGLMGRSLLNLVDTTPAGVYQHVGQDALPVAIDEFESETEADARRAVDVLKLARKACTGGIMARGGERHNPIQFRVRSPFLFSSINTPALRPQDLSRMAILRIGRLRPGLVPPAFSTGELEMVGRIMLRRMMDEWPRFKQTFEAFRHALGEGGLDARGQDTFACLLTCADMVEHEGWDDARLFLPCEEDGVTRHVGELFAREKLEEYEDSADNWKACLNRMLGARVEVWRTGKRRVVGQVLADFMDGDDELTLEGANALLEQVGLKIVRRQDRTLWLAVPSQSDLLRELFEGSIWAGQSGACVWAGALRQSERGTVHEVAQQRVAGWKSQCTMISLAALYGPSGILASEGKEW